MCLKFPQLFSYSPNSPNDHQLSPRTTIRSIPNEILLEIFDSFRRSFQREGDYERAWNSNKGWFKLAHVCQEWRRLVLTSPSRLHMRLLFTARKSGRTIAIRHLPPLPRIVDYRFVDWLSQKAQNRMISALAYPDRVCGITFNMSFERLKPSPQLLEAMNQPFPSLKSLEINWLSLVELRTPPPFVTAQTERLRSLNFIGGVTHLCRVLPYTTSLVDLTLRHHIFYFSPHDTRLLVHLQDLSSLRRLKVVTSDSKMPDHPAASEDVLLPALTSLSFTGSMAYSNIHSSSLYPPTY
jgi:hypothetical protein